MTKYKVGVCIATYKRPGGIRKLLESLTRLQFRKNSGVSLAYIVVDNDYSGSARQIVESYTSKLPGLFYAVEPVQSIALARNRAVAVAKKLNCECVAFVDDDEFVTPFWLDELLFALRKYSADIVRGPVRPVFDEYAPSWIKKSRFFEQNRCNKTGETIRWGATNNVILRLGLLDRLDGPFDQRFGLTGGEDTNLFERLYNLGALMVCSSEAIVWEAVPASRANLRWIVRRSYRLGNTLAINEKVLNQSKKWVLVRLGKGVGRILQGSLFFLPSLLLDPAFAVKQLTYIARGCGMIAGILGRQFKEYQKSYGA